MFGNTCSLHVSFVSSNPTTTHCNNMFRSALFCIIRRPAASMFQMFSPASSLYASFPSHSVCFLSVLPLPSRFKMFNGRPAAFIRFKCFQVDQQPLCVCLCFISLFLFLFLFRKFYDPATTDLQVLTVDDPFSTAISLYVFFLPYHHYSSF